MEVLQILTMQNSSMEVALAGILHDTLEETRTRPIEIEREFGPEVLRLIQAYMEKKGAGNRQRSWKARKTDRLKRLRSVDKAVKQLAMADTLSNMRTMVYDYYTFGDAFWSRCSASKEELEWYYREKIAIFAEFINDGQLKSGYWELNNLFNHLFTNYYAEGEEETTGIYRAAKDQITYCPKGTAGDSAEQAVEALPENVQHITKAEAEKIKENWMI